ncbi:MULTISPECIES: DUF3046 domain-containing protein [unclassified Leifsonia]|jgi:hypothetical protein|uniref:DUF3046 domain-containing protein n=1 Tax=unclassified Leifsonia TaxID=2663824 RepID=UPI0008A7F2C3|nr:MULTISPECIES: DUF3046 domain-containing protein [unclassified Leifsonia]SEH90186.1 Protein of unknown function [Leifsonia sp. CL154]SFL53997.1 Protein of unknown function [Leifsonia sp. CL147]
MKLSEFQRAVSDEFGRSYGQALLTDLVLGELGGRTAAEALAAGRAPREVWLALCKEAGVPASHWYGAGKPAPKR